MVHQLTSHGANGVPYSFTIALLARTPLLLKRGLRSSEVKVQTPNVDKNIPSCLATDLHRRNPDAQPNKSFVACFCYGP